MIPAQLVRERDRLDRNAAQRDSATAFDEGYSFRMEGKRKMSLADLADEIHGENIPRIAVHDTHEPYGPRADIKDEQRVELTGHHWDFRGIGSSLLTPCFIREVQVAPPQQGPRLAVVGWAASPKEAQAFLSFKADRVNKLEADFSEQRLACPSLAKFQAKPPAISVVV
ncbi:MAG TPA: hypothetical protein VK807_15410 [Gemmatimonadaceae bacterium]|nr:hypothetical protein [Gemmatimonadaceae bacterium]